ncbi:Protein CREG1 isoform D [Glycine soja]|uniref:Protein CREG1 isoform D n=1 Tax=Glycine soja TaxID=3848 RepID=A0A445G1T1_GLYSO|nr:Protein CREG1 isoform D [Glycine soja]
MNPTCSKISLTAKLKLVDEKSKEAKIARNALFSKHPEMKGNCLITNELEAFILSFVM